MGGRKSLSCLQEGEREPEELQPVKSPLSPWEDGEAANPGNHFREE